MKNIASYFQATQYSFRNFYKILRQNTIMNIKWIVGALIFYCSFGSFSCSNKPEYEETTVAADTTTVVDSSPTQEELAALKDKAREDSIANEKRLRLIEEDKQRKLLDAEEEIKTLSSKLMKRVSPVTGRNLVYQIISSESSYDELTNSLSAVFETKWEAIPDFNPNSVYETHTFKGKVIIYGTGETRIETISKNDVLIRAISASSAAESFIEWLNENSKNN